MYKKIENSQVSCIFGFSLFLSAFIFYYILLGGKAFILFSDDPHGLVYNSMLFHMLRGRWDVGPSAIGQEAFVRDGLAYAYFGPFPALLRLPLLVLPDWEQLHVERLSCLLAMMTAAAAQSAAVLASLPRGRALVNQAVAPLLLVCVVLGGTPVAVSAKGALVYHEAILWAWAFASLFVAVGVTSLLQPGGPTTASLCLMALLAGLCLLTRVTTAIGLFVGLGLLLLRVLLRGGQGGIARRLAQPTLWAPGLILLAAVLSAALVNLGRWGNPLVFADLHRQVFQIARYPDRVARLDRFGLFNVRRLGFGILYYFVPVWTDWLDAALPLKPRIAALFDALERPASSFLLTDPLSCWLAVLGLRSVVRRTAFAGASLLAAGFAVPPVLMLMAWYMAFRYRVEFQPLLLMLACIGLVDWLPLIDRSAIRRVQLVLMCLCALQLFGTVWFALAYQRAEFGPSCGYVGLSLFAQGC